MRVARYRGGGTIAIEEEPTPSLPSGGLLVRTEASGLCSGELMDWYMDAKAPHVLGHEVAGVVVESDDERFPVGCRVAPHHHAPCGHCPLCARGAFVHCPAWKSTRLHPGGMAELFAVDAANLADTHRTDDLRPIDAALTEPLACVAKCLQRARIREGSAVAVIGLGTLGLAHALLTPGAVGYDLSPARRAGAAALGVDARDPCEPGSFETVVLCPGTPTALDLAVRLVAPDGTIALFAPMPPGAPSLVPLHELYFRDVNLVSSYSCGPDDTARANGWLRDGRIRAEQIVSEFVMLDELPHAYQRMKRGETLKPMVVFA